MAVLLELVGVSSGYGRTHVLRDVSLTVGAGEIVALIGANGAGKSTLLNTVMGLVPLAAGAIRFAGAEIGRAGTPAIVRAGIAQVPERRQLFGDMTIEENLRMGAYARADAAAAERDLAAQFARFPILDQRRRQLARTMSGGEQQMAAIARAMMSRPKLLLLDEPSLGLAPLIVRQVFGEIEALRHAGGTILLVEQNARAALEIADRGYVLETGRIALAGTSRALLEDPAVQDAYLGGQGSGSRAIEERIRRRKAAILGGA
jgi:branched-chain amino acid transport system ATP-binding protein